jgi:hypothetical protein
MIIEVTQEDIDSGISTQLSCPIARSIARATGRYRIYRVGRDRISRGRGSSYRMVQLSRSAKQFVERFDDRKPVKPTRFRVRLP